MGREDKRLLICPFLKACHAIFAHPNILKLGRITNFLFSSVQWKTSNWIGRETVPWKHPVLTKATFNQRRSGTDSFTIASLTATLDLACSIFSRKCASRTRTHPRTAKTQHLNDINYAKLSIVCPRGALINTKTSRKQQDNRDGNWL